MVFGDNLEVIKQMLDTITFWVVVFCLAAIVLYILVKKRQSRP